MRSLAFDARLPLRLVPGAPTLGAQCSALYCGSGGHVETGRNCALVVHL
jgi:hypothetical protein